MIRILLLFTIMASLGLRCIAVSIEQVSAGQNPQIPGAAPSPSAQATPPPRPPEQVSPDAPVVTIQGLCPDGQQRLEQSDSCTLVFTRSQFEAMVKAVNVTDQNYTLPALKSLATSYVTVLTLADAAEKEGIDKDPRFQELLKVSRERSLADAYRLYLKEKFSNPSQAEIEEYYNKNIAKFEQVKVDRILIPKVNSKRSQEKPEEFTPSQILIRLISRSKYCFRVPEARRIQPSPRKLRAVRVSKVSRPIRCVTWTFQRSI